MTRMTPAQYVAGTKNATGGGAATPTSTSGVQMPTPEKEDMMSNHTPAQPWLDALDPAEAKHLTGTDVAKLDADFVRWSTDDARALGFDLVDYIRDCATDMARVRRIIGPADVPLPEFATVHKHSEWELTEDGTDAVRYLDAIYANHKGMTASLEVDQYGVSTRMDMRVRIGEGTAEDPAELTRWALDLLALAEQWKQILKERA